MEKAGEEGLEIPCFISYQLGPVIQKVDTCYPIDKWLSRRSVLTKCTVLFTG